MANAVYTSFRQYAARYDLDKHALDIFWASGGRVISGAQITGAYDKGGLAFRLSDYKTASGSVEALMDGQRIKIEYADGPEVQSELTLTLTIDRRGVEFRMSVGGHLDVHIEGEMDFGPEAFPVSLDRRGACLRAALGPAAAPGDNALLDRQRDAALEITGVPDTLFTYDWARKGYRFALKTGGDDVTRSFRVRVHEDVYKHRFNIPYAPVNKRSTFPTPPAGWMTWYAVQFDASEKTVLENARFQAEHLAKYGANAIWVDWEWYHDDFSGTIREGVDVFHPSPARYPRGLKALAEEIAGLGLAPALWIGATNDPGENEFFQNHLDAVLEDRRAWCGRYFIDPTHPLVKEEYIPRAFRQIPDWGYKALKWDCLPTSLSYWDRNHDRFSDPSVSSDDALRGLMRIARKTVGPDFYMLSCSGTTMRDIGAGADIFDAARIGGDIFRWQEFVSQCVGRILKLYALHNVALFCDPDNVVLREKYNTLEQARSRASLVGVLGLPFTFGDILPELPEERLDLIRHSIPPMDMHPMDIRENPENGETLVVNLAVATPWENWNVLDVLNLKQEASTVRVSLQEDARLPSDGDYLVFDFWNRKFLGRARTGFSVELEPCASRVLGIRRLTDRPQILATTRHLTQGALELRDVTYDPERMVLSGVSDVVGGDDYAIYLYVPENLRPFREGNDTDSFEMERVDVAEDVFFESQCPNGSVWRMPLSRDQSQTVSWKVGFIACHPL
jgi:hypothetical protein